MIKYIFGTLVAIVGALMAMYFLVGVHPIYREAAKPPLDAHMYNDTSQSIADISLLAVYFVPRNRQNNVLSNWKEVLEKNIQKLKEFHSLQLQGRSSLTYTIYPEPIIGDKEGIVYDTDITQHGNPEALKSITFELETRGFVSTEGSGTPYSVLLIMYEGVGASGGDTTALISRTFLVAPEYREFGASILAHEFYHTLGIPDGFDLTTAISTTSDIMGLGRFRPIEKTYLNKATLTALGL